MPISQLTINKFIAGGARTLSNVLHPFLMPTYGALLVLWTSVLCLLPPGTRVAVLVVCMGITCMLPIIFVSVLRHYELFDFGNFSSRRKRAFCYLFCAACNAAAGAYLLHSHAPMWFVSFMLGAAAAALVTAIVSWMWKISPHMAGIGTVIALICQLQSMGLGAIGLFWLLCFAIMVAGLLGTALMALRRQTLWQLVAGVLVGYACVTITMKLLG